MNYASNFKSRRLQELLPLRPIDSPPSYRYVENQYMNRTRNSSHSQQADSKGRCQVCAITPVIEFLNLSVSAFRSSRVWILVLVMVLSFTSFREAVADMDECLKSRSTLIFSCAVSHCTLSFVGQI